MSGLDVLVFSQFFSPEMGAPAARFHDFGRLLVERGHRVTVVTGFPNFPSGRVHEGYRGRLRQREVIDGIDVRRGWLYASDVRPGLTKPLGYASFVASASLWGLVSDLRADVVVATSPPPTVVLPAFAAASRLHAPLVFDVRDIWPEAIVDSGRARRGLVIRALEAVERRAYGRASLITVVTEGKRDRLVERGVPADKIAVVPNGVDLGRIEALQPMDEWLRARGVGAGRFLVTYAGIFGPSQGLDIFFDAAARLRQQHPDLAARVQFVLAGAGVERDRLLRRREQEGLADAIVFVGELPRELVPSLLAASDAIAVTLRPRKDTHTVPSKIYESIASGRPVIVSANGAPAEIVEQAKAGIATPAGDVAAFTEAVRRLASDPEAARQYGEAGRSYAVHFDRRHLVAEFEALLMRVAGRRG